MRVVIIASGENTAINSWSPVISGADYVIAADGGIFNCLENNIRTDCIIGDLDSLRGKNIPPDMVSEIIQIEDQNSTDMEKALLHAKALNPSVIDVFCAFGKRMDHSLGNILILDKNRDMNIFMHDAYGTMFGLDPGLREFRNLKGTTISLFALAPVANIVLKGFEYPYQQQHTDATFLGVSNRIAQEYASITFKKGRLLVYQIRDEGQK